MERNKTFSDGSVIVGGRSYLLRSAGHSDVPELRRLVNSAYKELSDQGLNYTATFQDEETTLRRLSEGTAFVLLDEQKIIATILLSEKNFSTGTRSAYLSQFAVSPPYKKAGIGRFLMDFCEELARKKGYQTVQLDTAKPAEHLVRWYLKLGYRVVGEAYWEGKTYESYIFEKDIRNYVTDLTSPEKKRAVCSQILRQLPDWFGIPSAVEEYCRNIQTQQAWSLHIGDELAGFIAVKEHSERSAELTVMGVLQKYHGSGWGKKLVTLAENYLSSRGIEFFQVKTLSPSRPDFFYDKTREFYLSCGFKSIEELKNLWGAENPCLLMSKKIRFSPASQLSVDQQRTQNFSHLIELEKQLHSPKVRKSVELLKKFLAPDFLEQGS